MISIRTITALFICLLLPLAIGWISGYATASGIHDWYITLHKPSFNPPNYLFGPVWTLLYLLMGVSVFIIWRSNQGRKRNEALKIFAIQITFNFLWSFLFFRFNLVGVAFMDILVIWFSIVLMIFIFRRVNKIAAYLQIPYLLWVTYATTLNGAIWLLN